MGVERDAQCERMRSVAYELGGIMAEKNMLICHGDGYAEPSH